jgi:hypothetical protein
MEEKEHGQRRLARQPCLRARPRAAIGAPGQIRGPIDLIRGTAELVRRQGGDAVDDLGDRCVGDHITPKSALEFAERLPQRIGQDEVARRGQRTRGRRIGWPRPIGLVQPRRADDETEEAREQAHSRFSIA